MTTTLLVAEVELSKQLGDTKRAIEVGYSYPAKVIWAACVDCGKERWVRIVKGQLGSSRCPSCGRKNVAKYGKDNPLWKGGRYKDTEGYIQMRITPDDFFYPMTNSQRHSIPEHRLVIAQHLGRCLEPWEIVHHKNGIKDDNRFSNLELLPSQAYHISQMRMQQEIQTLKERCVLLEAELVIIKVGV